VAVLCSGLPGIVGALEGRRFQVLNATPPLTATPRDRAASPIARYAGVPGFGGDLPVPAPSPAPQPRGGAPSASVPLAPPAAIDLEIWRRNTFRSRLRLGLAFSFLVSLLLHSSLLPLFVGGTAPGSPDGEQAVSVDVITQEQFDLLLGSGSSQGGKPPEVSDAANGTERSQQTRDTAAPRKSESEAERKEALSIVTTSASSDLTPVGRSERVNSAAAEAPRRSDRKATAQGSLKDADPSRRTEPKDMPDSDREDARTQAPSDPANPGAEGGEMRRVASKGGVGEQLGPLPPSMRQVLMQIMQKQIELCYVPPSGKGGNGELPLILIRLRQDGTLDGLPKSLRFERTAAGKSLVKAALKAVRQCAPYRLPPRFQSYYDDWKEIRAEFEFSSR
jgi:hypothetical protein